MLERENNPKVALVSVGIILFFVIILAVPYSREIFRVISGEHPFLLGFIKFALLATVGEIISLKFSQGVWKCPSKIIERAFIWGILGVIITFALKVFASGIGSVVQNGLLPGEGNLFLTALYTSIAMNVLFGPTMMGIHRITDKNIDMKVEGVQDITIYKVVQNVNWGSFVSFVVLKTIPLFWIPAHTITFMLPSEYQTIMAAFLSVALGIILGFSAKIKS
ncbi:MAG: hypothetical protein ACK5MV_11835 [Aminipila sp.]